MLLLGHVTLLAAYLPFISLPSSAANLFGFLLANQLV